MSEVQASLDRSALHRQPVKCAHRPRSRPWPQRSISARRSGPTRRVRCSLRALAPDDIEADLRTRAGDQGAGDVDDGPDVFALKRRIMRRLVGPDFKDTDVNVAGRRYDVLDTGGIVIEGGGSIQ